MPSAPSSIPPIVLALPRGARISAFADGCRSAVLDFVNRVSPTALFECSRCGALVFDAQRIEGRMCQAHESDVRDLMEAAGAPRRALAG